jgi:phosphoglycerate dehydrogenase-like enzyme
VAEVLVLEGVAGTGIDRLGGDFSLERAASLQEAAELADVRALIVRNRTRVDAAALAALPALEVVGRAGAGLDNIDLPATAHAGVRVTYAPGLNAAGTAEHTLALALAVAHRVCELDRVVRAGGWERRHGSELAGDVWGVVGFGRIGRRVAALAAGIGMRVLAFDPAVDDDAIREAGAEPGDLDAVAAAARVLSLHVPLTPATHGLAGAALLGRMRADAIVVNTARGELLDEAALADALRGGRLAGAGLDVRHAEPPGAPDPLAGLEQVVLTPHVAGLSREAQERITEAVAADVAAVLRGGAPQFEAAAA